MLEGRIRGRFVIEGGCSVLLICILQVKLHWKHWQVNYFELSMYCFVTNG